MVATLLRFSPRVMYESIALGPLRGEIWGFSALCTYPLGEHFRP